LGKGKTLQREKLQKPWKVDFGGERGVSPLKGESSPYRGPIPARGFRYALVEPKPFFY
jgi:hypothetical protein